MDLKINRLFICVFLLAVLFSPALSAQELGRPDQVDVFPQGAHVTWILEAQPTMTLFLPSSFFPHGIRYQTRDDAVVNQMVVVVERVTDWWPAGLEPLVLEIQQRRGEIEASMARLTGINQTIDYLRSFSLTGNEEDPLDFMVKSQRMRMELELQRMELLHQIAQAEGKVSQLEERLGQLYAGDLNQLIQITFTTNGLGSLELTAFTPYASWGPFYRAHLDSNEQTMALNSYVQVRQQTGILWEGPINCHTRAPHDQVYIPAVHPLVVRILEEARVSAPLRTQVKEMSAMDMAGSEPSYDLVRLDGEAGITFMGEGRVSTDGRAALLLVDEDSFLVQIYPTLIPYQEKEAFLMVETIDPVRSLLQGQVELMVDGSYAGISTLQHAGGGESLEMAFGRSPLITAEREGVVYQERRTWLGKRILQDGYQITILNGTRDAVEVAVMDRVPVAGDDRIVIRFTITPEPLEQEEGLLLWQLTVAPDTVYLLSVEYEIEYPDGLGIIYY